MKTRMLSRNGNILSCLVELEQNQKMSESELSRQSRATVEAVLGRGGKVNHRNSRSPNATDVTSELLQMTTRVTNYGRILEEKIWAGGHNNKSMLASDSIGALCVNCNKISISEVIRVLFIPIIPNYQRLNCVCIVIDSVLWKLKL